MYPGVDLIYHGDHQQLEYDFVVAPGANPRLIRLRMEGAKSLKLTSEGDLLVGTSGESVRLRRPVLYQEVAGQRRPVDGSFVLTAKNTIEFRVGAYDRSKQLVIDPVLAYSTLFGGSGFEETLGIAVDSTGAAYITGLPIPRTWARQGRCRQSSVGLHQARSPAIRRSWPKSSRRRFARLRDVCGRHRTTDSGGIAVFWYERIYHRNDRRERFSPR